MVYDERTEILSVERQKGVTDLGMVVDMVDYVARLRGRDK